MENCKHSISIREKNNRLHVCTYVVKLVVEYDSQKELSKISLQINICSCMKLYYLKIWKGFKLNSCNIPVHNNILQLSNYNLAITRLN